MQKAYLGVGVSQGAFAEMIVALSELCCIDGDGSGGGDVILPRTKRSVACSTNTGHTLKGHRHRVPMLEGPRPPPNRASSLWERRFTTPPNTETNATRSEVTVALAERCFLTEICTGMQFHRSRESVGLCFESRSQSSATWKTKL